MYPARDATSIVICARYPGDILRDISARSSCAPVSAEYDQISEKDECVFPLSTGFIDVTVDRRDITLLMDKDLLLTEFEVTKLGTEIFPVR